MTRAPLTNVPFVEPTSSTQRPSGRGSSSAWRVETKSSPSSRIAFSPPRPRRVGTFSSTVRPDCSAGLSSTSMRATGAWTTGSYRERSSFASWALSTIDSCGAERRSRVTERTTDQMKR